MFKKPLKIHFRQKEDYIYYKTNTKVASQEQPYFSSLAVYSEKERAATKFYF